MEHSAKMLELLVEQPIFVGFKLDTSLRRQVDGLTGPDRKYISVDDSTFLRLCRDGEDHYVGKLIDERLSTDRIEDIRRNILSIMQRLFPEVRFPTQMQIFNCKTTVSEQVVFEDERKAY